MLVDGSKFYRLVEGGLTLQTIDPSGGTVYNGGFFASRSTAGFDINIAETPTASNFVWADRANFSAVSYPIDVSGFTSDFMFIAKVVDTTTWTNEGAMYGIGIGDTADPASATAGALAGWQDVAGGSDFINVRASQAWGTINSNNAIDASRSLQAQMNWNDAKDEGLWSLATFYSNAPNETTASRQSDGSGSALDVSGGTLHLYLFGARQSGGAPASNFPMRFSFKIGLVDLSGLNA